jgi:hypothetical protein
VNSVKSRDHQMGKNAKSRYENVQRFEEATRYKVVKVVKITITTMDKVFT